MNADRRRSTNEVRTYSDRFAYFVLAHIGLHYTLTQTGVLARFPVVAVGIAALALVYSWLWTLLARSLSCLHCSSLLLLCLGPASASFKLYAFVTPA